MLKNMSRGGIVLKPMRLSAEAQIEEFFGSPEERHLATEAHRKLQVIHNLSTTIDEYTVGLEGLMGRLVAISDREPEEILRFVYGLTTDNVKKA